MAKRAPSELVAAAWIATIPGITTDIVATTLPTEITTWADTGFITVGPEFGGNPMTYVPMRRPVMQIDTWGVNPNVMTPNWGQASDLAELIMAACYDNLSLNLPLNVRTGYNQARVAGAMPVTEPRRIRNDDANYGRYQLDVELHWIEIIL